MSVYVREDYTMFLGNNDPCEPAEAEACPVIQEKCG